MGRKTYAHDSQDVDASGGPHFTKLPGAVKGEFVTRFSPESSGILTFNSTTRDIFVRYVSLQLQCHLF